MTTKIRGCYVTLLTILCVLPCLVCYLNGPDVWFHMACGKEMLATGKVDVSKFYYTVVNTNIRDFKFTWLGDILLYLTHFVGGQVGLQVLRVECIALMLYCMWIVSDRKLNLFKGLVATLVVYGTSHLFTVRNAMFGAPFVCALWLLHLNDVKHKHTWSLVLLIVWSQVHGSVLLGLCMYCILAVRTVNSALAVFSVVFVVEYALPISILDYVQVPASLNLNEVLFRSKGLISKDFCSPFYIEKHYTSVMLILSVMHVVLIKRVRLVYVVPFISTLVPALGYLRMVGFQAITCGMCLVYAERMGDLRTRVHPSIVLVLLLLAGYDGWKNNYNRIGLGVSPLYSSITGAKAERNIFTQDYLTSYLYFNYGVKGFFSTFHAPHPECVMDTYVKYTKNPDVIDNSINTCIVKDRVYADRFFNSTKWTGSKQGCVYIFNRKSVNSS